jgi:hypothetical protein
MTARLVQRSIFLVFMLAFAYAASMSGVATDFRLTGAATHAPSNQHDDAIWQSARQITTTTGVSFRIGKHDLCTGTIVPPPTLTAVRSQLTNEFGSNTRDRSPQHSIPLLI